MHWSATLVALVTLNCCPAALPEVAVAELLEVEAELAPEEEAAVPWSGLVLFGDVMPELLALESAPPALPVT